MTKQWLAHFNDVPLALVAFLIFVAMFAAILVWTFRKNSKPYYHTISNLPFKDGEDL